MSIKLLAIELYRAQQNVDRLEAQLTAAPHNGSLHEELRHSLAELQLLRTMLEKKKASSQEMVLPRKRSF